MISLTSVSGVLWLSFLLINLNQSSAYSQLDSILTDSLFREFVNRDVPGDGNFEEYLSDMPSGVPQQQTDVKDYPSFEARRDDILERDMNIRDEEYLEHSSLTGHKSMQGGNGEGFGNMPNHKFVKTDQLPAFCNPANPCPLGFKAEDGCLEEFENTAKFSREYQAQQNCLCDSEHMFDCPGATRENEIDALARSFENEGLADTTLNRLMQNMEIRTDHKVVAKKFFSHKSENPYLEGEKLPVVAKKAPKMSIM